MTSPTVEPLTISLKTPAGELSTAVDVPTGFVPITSIVPLLHRLSDAAQSLEMDDANADGLQISCAKGCAACCRMLVPVSAPEAFMLKNVIEALPEDRRKAMLKRVADSHARLGEAGLLDRLIELADSDRRLSDDDMEPINQDYYALRMPCPFLENEMCAIYEHRPSACRELLVTTPPDLCQDLANNPVRPLPVSVRMSTAFALLWSELTGTTEKLIPLPVALHWADRHPAERDRRWTGMDLLEKALDKIWRFLSQEFANRRNEENRT
ncbi:MAG: YkgJ family cysteine cluster protein [Nitrospiraceae bacterium]